MKINELIRQYRVRKNLTQEEVAKYLGVSTPAVNKWENGKSMPDITLLAPIARLLGITIDELLSFKENLSEIEANQMVEKAIEKLKTETYDEVFQWVKKKIEEYPTCEFLILWMTRILDSQSQRLDISESQRYDEEIEKYYSRVLGSSNETMKISAAESLFYFHFNKKNYESAEEYLEYFSVQNPERKNKQALIFSTTDRMEEAYKSYEELLFSGYQQLDDVFRKLYLLAMKEKNDAKAHYYIKKHEKITDLFEMGEYRKISGKLDLLVEDEDSEATLEMMGEMLASVNEICAFTESPLYEHMVFKSPSEEFLDETRKNLVETFCDENIFGYLKGNPKWESLLKGLN